MEVYVEPFWKKNHREPLTRVACLWRKKGVSGTGGHRVVKDVDDGGVPNTEEDAFETKK